MCPDGGDIEGSDLRPLIGWTKRDSGDRIDLRCATRVASGRQDRAGLQLLVPAVGRLEPGTREFQVQVDGVFLREGVVHTIEDVLFVTLAVKYDEFGGVEKSPGIQSIHRNEVAPGLSSISEISRECRGAKCPIRSSDAAMRRGHALS